MKAVNLRKICDGGRKDRTNETPTNRYLNRLRNPASLLALALLTAGANAQVNVLTGHNDTARTGQNINETILKPSNVNPAQFGKLFSLPVNGTVTPQPLYVSQLAIPGKGTHNVLFVATTSDYVYAFDADSNGGVSATPLWQVSLLTNSPSWGTLTNKYGVEGTPVIDLPSKTMYLVSSELQGTNYVFRVHALDITTGAEKFGGPILTQGSVPGTGVASVNGTVTFDGSILFQRPGLLLQNGILYTAFGSYGDNGPWHGWLFSYNAATLKQIDAFATTPNGQGAGIWMSGAGLAAEVVDPVNKPYGRMFVATGNGTFASNPPYTRAMSYSMSILDLDLTNGKFTVEDSFTPYNEHPLNGQDADLGAGGPILLPTETMASGKKLNGLLHIGKSGTIYLLDRDNNTDGSNNPATEYSPAGLGGFNAAGDVIVQRVQPPQTSSLNWGPGVWGTEAYWNNNIYSGGTNPGIGGYDGAGNGVTAYSYKGGELSLNPTSSTVEQFTFPGPTPIVSANGTTNGIVWVVKTDPFESPAVGYAALDAFDATNVGNTLYSSNTNLARDNPGSAIRFSVPTVVNGKAYVGTAGYLSVYGLFANSPTAPTPVISPAGNSTVIYNGTQTVTITDAVPGATIYYTTNGTKPTSASAVYNPAHPLVISTNATVTAIASANNYLLSNPASVTYQSSSTTDNPVFSLDDGTYSGAQTLTITDSSPNPTIYYTLDGTTPTTASAVYAGPISIPVSETVQAIAVSAGLFASPVVSASYTIQPNYVINYINGFAGEPMLFNGSTDLDDIRLQLTNGGKFEAGSAYFPTKINVQSFTTDFQFQLSNPAADGMTFVIQNAGPTAVGGSGVGLGYSGIGKSIAIKFDLFNNFGEGPNSTGLYINGAMPTLPAINLTGTGIDLHDNDYFDAHISYDGTNLVVTLTDYVTLASWSQAFPINIPATVGGNTAYVGFTGGSGGLTASQKVLAWTYVVGGSTPNYPTGFDNVGMSLNGGSTLVGTRVRLTDGRSQEARSAFYTTPVNVTQFYTNFDLQFTNANADGMTFTIQGSSPKALGSAGEGLGYTPNPTLPVASQMGTNNLAIKFDLFSNQDEGPNSTGLYTHGTVPTVPSFNLTPSGVNLHSGHILNVQLAYDGTTLTEVIVDTVTLATATTTYSIDIPTTVGGAAAYVGFTAGSGGGTAIQDVLNWTYSGTYSAPITAVIPTMPTFSTGFKNGAGLILNGGSTINGSVLNLTDGGTSETRSAFFSTPLNAQLFTSDFTFQLPKPATGDGFTFAIQGSSSAALGLVGGGLGFQGIPTSVAVKFDLYSNAGEGLDSTGLYTNGAYPTLPAIDLSSTGINLHSGDLFHAHLVYNGTTLAVTITDTVTAATATQTYTVNIPAIVGGTTAYFGFTGGSGGSTAIQNINTWSYSATN